MARRNQSQFSRILKQLIGKETRKPSRRNSPSARRSLRAEHLEARRVFAGLVFDSVILAGSDTSTASPQSSAVDGAGNTYMVGYVFGATDFDLDNTHTGDTDIIIPRGNTDGFVAKYDQNNEFLWVRRVGGDSPDAGTDVVQDIGVDAAGNVYITGDFNDLADFGPFAIQSQGASDGFAAKLDTNENFQWVKSWGGIENYNSKGIVVSDQGRISVMGTTGLNSESTLPQSLGIDIRQFDSSGVELWSHLLLGDAFNGGRISSTAAGELVVSGGFQGDVDLDPGISEFLVSGPTDAKSIFVMQLSTTGSFQWGNSLIVDTVANPGSKLYSAGMTIGSDGSVALIADLNGTVDVDANGTGHLVDAGSTQKRLFARYDAAGQFQVATIHSDDPFLYTGGITAVGSGYYATGTTDGSGVFQPAPGISVVGNRYSMFLMEMDQNGTPISAMVIGGTGNELPPNVQTDSNGNLLVIGSSSSATIDFDPDPINTAIHTNPAFADGFVLSLRPTMPGEPATLFGDSFEQGEWNELWVEDIQNDWFRSSQRATSGSFAAEVDGSASNATLTTANIIDLSGMASATLSFDWLIESGFDSGEYLSLDISTDGGSSWTQDLRRLNGNVSAENVWHSETVDMTPYKSADLKVRFRSKVSASDEDANVDNVRIVGIADGPNTAPTAVVGGPYSVNEGSSIVLSGAGSNDPDGSIASYAWDFDNDGQYDDASGVSVSFSTTVSGLHSVGLQVTDNRGATAVTSTTVSVNNIAPTANAGSDVDGFVGTPVSLSASGSSDPGNDLVSYAWDLDNDGQYDDTSGVNATFTAAANGTYIVSVLVTDADGATSTDSATITLSTISATSTKFYVVDDGGPDRTYEYGATGNAIENYTINSGNTQPRGAASNSAGDKVWVADRNRKVYVYDTSGGLLGSWSAGTLASTASVEGIATNGTDVWIVDSRSDKVFRYANAAGRTSGSQPAVSSFALNSSNRSSKGIVTDGSYLWIIDSSTTDKIFKYTVTGSLVGSWTIDSANNSPTGLTIDPTGASQSIWIVDSGTDKVYEYTNALGKSSGSQSAANTFALIAGNTNPQGIADPPPADSAVSSTRWTAAQPVSPMPPAVVASQTNSTASRIADDDQRKSLTRSDTTTARLSLQPAASQSQDQSPLSDEFVHVKLPEADHTEARHTEGRIDHFFLEDSFELVDDALLSLLAHK